MGRKAHCSFGSRLTTSWPVTGSKPPRLLRRLKLLVAIGLAAVTAGAGTPAHSQVAAPVSIAKTCGSGYTHAIIGGQEKCLRAGEFCTHKYDYQYRRYGYRCIRYDASVARY